jgi:hypothetical protein
VDPQADAGFIAKHSHMEQHLRMIPGAPTSDKLIAESEFKLAFLDRPRGAFARFSGGAGEIRTPGLRFRKPPLYHVELKPRAPISKQQG